MGDDYWGPVFARLLEDTDLLGRLCRDTADADLLNWVLPNRPLAQKCARYIRRHKITNRAALLEEVMDAAIDDQELRKIILFTWIEKNPKTMGFLSVPANADNIAKLIDGHYGKPVKIRLLARIDPRKGAERIYQKYFAEHPELELEEKAAEAATLAMPDLEKRLQETTEMATKAVKRSRELESANEKIKADNKQLKKDLESRDKEVSHLARNLEENARQLKAANARIDELERQATGLQRQLDSAARSGKATTGNQPPADGSLSDTNRLAEELATLKETSDSRQQQIDSLQKALQNRDRSIARLEEEKAELLERQRHNEDQQRCIEKLQASLKTLESEQAGPQQMLAGQLATRIKGAGTSSDWLFVSVTGRAMQLPASLVKDSGVIVEEFSLLYCDADERPLRLVSLETSGRRELLGYVKEEAGSLWLVTDSDERLPVCVDGSAFVDKPVRGICLGETDQREAGVYHLEALKTAEEKNFAVFSASPKQIMAFFAADQIDFDAFCHELGKMKVSFRHDKDQHLRFSRDYRQILTGLRPSLPVASYCATPACSGRARNAIMARACRPGQACTFCGGFPTEEGSEDVFQFNGQQVLIFGGDRIGSEYERVLARHNLLVTWHSGFDNLRELRSGLGKTDVVVIIVRQISHTLLREIVPLADKEGVPVLYCSRRGTAGVLETLMFHFRATNKKR